LKATAALLLTVLVSLPALAAGLTTDSGELALSPQRFGPAAGGFRDKPVLAMGSDSFVIVWEERRNAADLASGRVWARIYTPEGSPKQGGAMDLGPGTAPAAVWNGAEYFIVWTRNYSSASFSGPRPLVEALRLSENGVVATDSRVVLAAGTEIGTSGAAVAWNGSAYGVGWNNRVALVDRNGKVLASSATLLTAPKAAALRGDFLFIGRRGDGEDAVLMTSTGEASTVGRIFDQPANYAMSSTSTEFVAVFAGEKGVNAFFFGPSGSSSAFLTLTNDPSTDVALTFEGSSFIAVYTADHTVCYRRFTTEAPGVSGCFARNFDRRAPSIDASLTSIAMAVVERTNDDVDQIAFATAPAPNVPDISESSVVSEFAQGQDAPAILRDALGTTVLWTEASLGRNQIWWGHVDENGVRSTDHVLAPSAFAQSEADIALGSGDALAVWQEQPGANRIAAIRVSPAGDTRGAAFNLGNGFAPSVASNGRDWLVVWISENFGSFPFSNILMTLVTEGGTVATQGGIRVDPSDALRTSPQVIWNGREFLVIWTQFIGSNTQLVRGVRVSAGGTVIGEVKTLLDVRGVGSALVAWNGREYLLVAHDALAVHIDRDLNPGARFVLPLLDQYDVQALENGLFAVVTASATESRVILVGAGGPVTSIPLPFVANRLDLQADGNRLRIGYSRDFTGLIPRVFLRVIGLDAGGLRRRART
jgi:hypothetical protein